MSCQVNALPVGPLVKHLGQQVSSRPHLQGGIPFWDNLGRGAQKAARITGPHLGATLVSPHFPCRPQIQVSTFPSHLGFLASKALPEPGRSFLEAPVQAKQRSGGGIKGGMQKGPVNFSRTSKSILGTGPKPICRNHREQWGLPVVTLPPSP
jgi:hypothetical protein